MKIIGRYAQPHRTAIIHEAGRPVTSNGTTHAPTAPTKNTVRCDDQSAVVASVNERSRPVLHGCYVA